MTRRHRTVDTRAFRGTLVVATLWLATSLAACGNLLEVENPNSVQEEDIGNPAVAKYLVRGALGAVAAGYDVSLLAYSLVGDELDSRELQDPLGNLDRGTISDPDDQANRLASDAFIYMASGRWLADEAVRILEAQRANRTLRDSLDLAAAYLYSAMSYVIIGDMYDNFVFSNRDSAASPIGPANMGRLYDEAVARIDRGLGLATGNTTLAADSLRLLLTAMKARAQFGRAVWNLVGVRPIRTGLIGAADGVAARTTANAALAMITDQEWKFQFQYGATIGSSRVSASTNVSRVVRLGRNYVVPAAGGTFTWSDQVVLRDPVANVPDPVINTFQRAFRGQEYFPLTVVSARELRLIVAEASLAAGDMVTFQTQINAIRRLNALPDWTAASGVSAQRILVHERRANLLMQGRRLADQYRFGEPSATWETGSEALRTPGVFLPIPMVECRANPRIGAAACVGLGG